MKIQKGKRINYLSSRVQSIFKNCLKNLKIKEI